MTSLSIKFNLIKFYFVFISKLFLLIEIYIYIFIGFVLHMITIFSEKLPRILKNKKRLEEKLKVKITNKGKDVFVEGTSEDEYFAEKIIMALNFGFPFSIAMSIKEEESVFEILQIKDYTKRKDLTRIRARIIGKKGKALKTLAGLTKCNFEIKENLVGIVGPAEHIKNAQEAVVSIIKGSKHSNVYNFLEKRQPKPELDLGLKKKFVE